MHFALKNNMPLMENIFQEKMDKNFTHTVSRGKGISKKLCFEYNLTQKRNLILIYSVNDYLFLLFLHWLERNSSTHARTHKHAHMHAHKHVHTCTHTHTHHAHKHVHTMHASTYTPCTHTHTMHAHTHHARTHTHTHTHQ